MNKIIESFAQKVADGFIEIYNEFSLQHEFGIFLREYYPYDKVQFERNISYFFPKSKTIFLKREIDIAIFSPNKNSLHAAIELKFPRNGQYPEQMYSFCKDIAFLEQLKLEGFNRCYFIAFADDPLFYSGPSNSQKIYAYFRSDGALHGVIQKPTGKKDSEVTIRGSYKISWMAVRGQLKLTTVEIY